MLGKEFDLVLSAILLVLTIAFFIGKGEGILRLFSGNNYKRRKDGEQKKLERSCGFFCAVLAAAELAMAFLQEVWKPVGIVYLAAIILDLVVFSIYYKKNFQ